MIRQASHHRGCPTVRCPLLAQSRHRLVHCTCLLLGGKRTSGLGLRRPRDRMVVTPRVSPSLASVRGPFSLLWPPLPCFQKRRGSFPAVHTDRRGKSPISMP